MKIAEYLDIPMTERAGGVGTYIKSLSEEFVRLGHKVVINDGFSRPRFFSNRHMISVCKDADIHHFHEPSTALLMSHVKTIISEPINTAVTFHAPVSNILLRMPYSLITRLLYRNARLVLTTTKRNADYLTSKGVYTHVIPLWADQFFKPTSLDRYVRKPYVLSVCAVDKFHTYKNYPLISALGKLLRKRYEIDLVHVGIRDFDIPNVIHYGPVDRLMLRELYQNAIAFVLPSIGPYEGFGIVAAEALACATPVLVSSGCGISEFLDDCFVSSLSMFEDNLCTVIKELLDDPRRLIDRAYTESLNFAHDNCRKTVELIIQLA